ncbi:MAG: ABC transporter ATP-binding protein, partial [Clostridium sp.]|nr:ABC transporter ATP-binding protein [Clostridium sp.]
IELIVDDVARASTILEKELSITDYEVLENNRIEIFSNLDSSGIINSTLSKKGILVEKINIKGKSLEEYFMNKVGGAE